MKKNIVFLTGVSGVGKSTLLGTFSQRFPNETAVYLHFDSIGVPSEEDMIKIYGSGSEWQKAMTYRWVKMILGEYQDKSLVILEGQINVDFIDSACKEFSVTNYKTILIDCSNAVRHERLHQGRNQPELVNDTMDNWADFLRGQAKDKSLTIIDTSLMNVDGMVDALKKYLIL